VITACSVGPNYKRPEVWVPSAYKEPPPASFKEAEGRKVAQPNDGVPRGQWREICGDLQLNALEVQVDVSNQTLAVAEAWLRGARVTIGVACAALFPTTTGTATVTGPRQSLNRSGALQNLSSVETA
jgi:outer membrane protein TolC